MAKKSPGDYATEPPSPLETATPADNGKPRAKRKTPVTKQEIFDEETRIVRLLLRRIAALPSEACRVRVLNRIYELREFPLVDVTEPPAA